MSFCQVPSFFLGVEIIESGAPLDQILREHGQLAADLIDEEDRTGLQASRRMNGWDGAQDSLL